MSLGINSIKFQYLHALILLFKGDPASSDIRLSSALEAISILQSMVSNWSSVYNGVVWSVTCLFLFYLRFALTIVHRQLLYYPFTPFFVVFEHVVQSQFLPLSEIEEDLNLLSATVSYFAEMRSQMRLLATVCSRLQHTASVFHQLARGHASRQLATEPSHKRARLSETQEQHCKDLTEPDIRGVDVAHYLDWLPAEIQTTFPIQEPERLDPTDPSQRITVPGNMFDWFSWDTYYAGSKL